MGNDLPPLEGTPKQVAWAARIRGDLIADVERHCAAVDGDHALRVRRALAWVCSEVDAAWWIGMRDDGLALVLDRVERVASESAEGYRLRLILEGRRRGLSREQIDHVLQANGVEGLALPAEVAHA